MFSDYPGKMPDWVKNSFKLGIVIAVLNFLGFFGALWCSGELRNYNALPPYLQYIEYTGIPFAFITGFLIYGATKRKSSLILLWMIIAIIKSIADIIFGIWFATGIKKLHELIVYNEGVLVWWLELILTFIGIVFQIVGIFHAYKAIKEIGLEIGACSIKTEKLGIVIAAFNSLVFFGALLCLNELPFNLSLPYLQYIEYSGIPGAFISGLLIYGACQRQSSLILVWMIIITIKCFFDILFGIWFVIAVLKFQELSWWIEIGLTFANILFQLVGIFHANKTKKEIDGTEGYSPIPSGVAEVGTSA